MGTVWHAPCIFIPMLEQATAMNRNTHADASYKSWQSSLGKTVMRMDPEARTAAPVPTFGTMVHTTALAAQGAHPYAPAGTDASGKSVPDIAYTETKDDEFSFGDVIDMINPLQHLPVIGTLYRKFTGDTIKPMSDIIGGAIFGGPVGAVASTMNVVVKSTTGKDIAENAFAFAGFDVVPQSKKPALAYDLAASPNNLVDANMIKIASAAANAYQTADGRRNFAARTLPTAIWNA
jgi:hypothetical protein